MKDVKTFRFVDVKDLFPERSSDRFMQQFLVWYKNFWSCEDSTARVFTGKEEILDLFSYMEGFSDDELQKEWETFLQNIRELADGVEISMFSMVSATTVRSEAARNAERKGA